MALITKAVRGTLDLLPADIHRTRYVERTFLEIAESFGYIEIRTPVFEHTELFDRSAGETSDVVQKEMYTFTDRGGRSLSLKPEGTACVARAFLENGLFNEPLPQKMAYITPCYRYDKPQAGRYREHHQFGAECFGAASPAADAEVISIARHLFTYLGLENISLHINSIGCPECRKEYNGALKAFFEKECGRLCETCLSRLDKNPMRILDCKSPVCGGIAEKAPKTLEYICGECRAHFNGLKKFLDVMNIDFTIDPGIVRGLDYYTRTVFEFITVEAGSPITVCGGGRYDRLVEEIGGAPMPACGFGMGVERLILQMRAQGCEFPEAERCDLYIASTDEESRLTAAALAWDMRETGVSCQFDVCGRSLKAQMKFADKIGARYTAVIGSDETAAKRAKIKNMETGETHELGFEDFPDDFIRMTLDQALNEFSFGKLEPNEEGSVFTLLKGGKGN